MEPVDDLPTLHVDLYDLINGEVPNLNIPRKIVIDFSYYWGHLFALTPDIRCCVVHELHLNHDCALRNTKGLDLFTEAISVLLYLFPNANFDNVVFNISAQEQTCLDGIKNSKDSVDLKFWQDRYDELLAIKQGIRNNEIVIDTKYNDADVKKTIKVV